MTDGAFGHLLAEASRGGVRWHALPAAWVFWMVVVPAAVLVAWWSYQRDRDVPRGARALLAGLRATALVFLLLVLFGPYRETSEVREVRSHLAIIVDTSSSMSTVDGYEPEDARALAAASGRSVDDVGRMSREDHAKAVLSNPAHGLLERLSKDFRLHIYGFGSQLVPLVSTGDSADEENGDKTPPAQKHRARIADLRAVDGTTRIGQAVAQVLDAYRGRDEGLSGIVVVSDGRQTGAGISPVAAGRRAAAQNVPIYSVAVGDPRSPKNINVSNLRAKEVVLARDTTVFEFEVRAKGFENRAVPIEIQPLDDSGAPRGPPLSATPNEVVLKGGDDSQLVRVTYRFDRADTYALRIGVPVQDEEKIKSDNFVLHTLRVIDRKIKVLYVEDYPRWEFNYLSNSLTRDRETMLAHTLLLDADPESPQRRTNAPAAEWPPLESARALPSREKLFEYDVIILGDVDPRHLGADADGVTRAIENLRDFVDKGGGLIAIAGPSSMPSKYRDTSLAVVLPIVVDRNAESLDEERRRSAPPTAFHLALTPESVDSPLMNVAGDPQRSKRLWEEKPEWALYWSYPALRAKTLAKVLAESSDTSDDNRFGRRPIVATMPYGRGRTLFVGVDDLWRMRYDVGDHYMYRFYGEAVRFLATYKLLGGNKRFKITTDLETYSLDDQVRVTVDVLDRDYEPSRAESQTVKLDMPGAEPGKRETVDLVVPKDPDEKGVFRRPLTPTRPGDYRLTATTDDPKDEPPEKVFHVVQSSLETRELLLDEESLRDMASASAGADLPGRYRYLADLPKLEPVSGKRSVPTNVHEDEMWDNAWTLAIATGLLGVEWLLRKRWRLV
jgi:uncharacterized membrane protein